MSNTGKKRILVIDDDAMNREVMEAFLTVENYEVLLAHNGRSGLNLVRETVPDLVIVDVRMPDMTGYEVCEFIKSQESLHSIPVLIVTGFDAKEDRERGKQAGADAFLPRPFDVDELANVVTGLLN